MRAEIPVVSFICAACVLLPLPFHLKTGTVSTISLSLWLFVLNVIYGVNALIWSHTLEVTAVVWCDIATKIIVGANVALPACILCLCIHLEKISSLRYAQTTYSNRRRRMLFESALCFGVPLIYMALHYIVQGHRFDIVEDFGCRPSVYVSVASIFIIWVPPVSMCLASFVLSALAFRNFWQRRLAFTRYLTESNSSLTPSRYFRLMAMALVQMIWGLAVMSFHMWFTMKAGLRPWISWADVHSDFLRVDVFPARFVPKADMLFTYLLWWAMPITSILFCIFFAFGEEALKFYRKCFSRVTSVFPSKKPLSSKDTFASFDTQTPSKTIGLYSCDTTHSDKRSNSLGSPSTIAIPPPYYGKDSKSERAASFDFPSSPSSSNATMLDLQDSTDSTNSLQKPRPKSTSHDPSS